MIDVPYRTRWLAVAAAAGVLATGCATNSQRPLALEDARTAVVAARNDPQIATLAPAELDQAVNAYERADAAFRNRGDAREIAHLAYVARQRVAIAEQTTLLKEAELAVANADAERERVRLFARTQEAEDAARVAAQALLIAEAAKRDTAAAERQSKAARDEARLAQQRARQAQAAANASQQQLRAAEARAEQIADELRNIKAQPADRGVVVTLDDVLFDTGLAQLRSGGVRGVQRIAEFMLAYPNRTVAIEGFTDSVGTDESNRELSARRAEAVKLVLIEAGMAADRITTVGYGEQFPVATNDTSAGRQQNRRVEVVISDPQGKIGPRVARYGPAPAR